MTESYGVAEVLGLLREKYPHCPFVIYAGGMSVIVDIIFAMLVWVWGRLSGPIPARFAPCAPAVHHGRSTHPSHAYALGFSDFVKAWLAFAVRVLAVRVRWCIGVGRIVVWVSGHGLLPNRNLAKLFSSRICL